MDIVIDFEPIYQFLVQPFPILMWKLFITVGWVPIAGVFIWGAGQFWLKHIRGEWFATQRFLLLAIDIPRGNAQSPRAVENMFSHLAGAHGTLNFIEIWWEGKFQLSFSFEIVSIDGYTQFLIRTPEQFRDLVESSVYSQYPDAEITEVNDYTESAPDSFPDAEYDIWGAEFIQKKHWAYPIRTYEEFEHKFGEPEVQYKDPMASLMDLCSSLRKGEQLWYQIIVIPTGFEWPAACEKEISKILKEKVSAEKNILDNFIDWSLEALDNFGEIIYQLWGDISAVESKEEEPLKMMNLKPKEKKQVEAIQEKAAKIGYEIKIRFVYLAKKEVMNKPKVANGFVGYIKQFSSMDLNNLKPDMELTATSAAFFFRDKRLNEKKTNIIKYYKDREDTAGRMAGIMNIEELATIWHFPIESVVKAPMIQKVAGRKVEAPMSLPVGEELVAEEISAPFFAEVMAEAPKERKQESISEEVGEEENNEEEINKEDYEAGGTGGSTPANLPFA